jgi:hypothetical protein
MRPARHPRAVIIPAGLVGLDSRRLQQSSPAKRRLEFAVGGKIRADLVFDHVFNLVG